MYRYYRNIKNSLDVYLDIVFPRNHMGLMSSVFSRKLADHQRTLENFIWEDVTTSIKPPKRTFQ